MQPMNKIELPPDDDTHLLPYMGGISNGRNIK
jgi:hypothetical protein